MSAVPINQDPDCGLEKIVKVSLGKNGYPQIEPDEIAINRDRDEKVVWQAEEGVNFTVCFERETPFESFHFHPCLPSSGSVRKGAQSKEYKYCVEVNGKVIDPKVVVWP